MDFTEDMSRAMRELTDKGAFLSVKSARGVNTMTVSWGFIGMIWAKPHFIALVRPQRHTKKILEKADSFTVSIPYGGGFKEQLAVCGSESGADTDKSAVVEFVAARKVDSPVVGGCGRYYECKISMAQRLDGDLIAESIKKRFYHDDFHIMYFGEIIASYGGNGESGTGFEKPKPNLL